ncbi:glycosyltransferase family 28 protein [Candidatus Nitrosopumilus koreensis AR1]|uniref:Glycosyltransferase family 28 protein n=1 Tax=Candidatus Nitrosopumilus koreensis AR1 TaxID=1229908 RepID=K0B233_9ARCH|nr:MULTISPECIES: glycosyltransferase [Nitrosopumilus]AFS80073.1 glycosyltransferase family 28 protein [Candidatus Nitrosopumilus koreensis AR1]
MVHLDFFSSPIGLGHITRDIAIESNFQNITTNFVTGSGAARILKKLEIQVEDVYKPPSFTVENGILKNPAKWLWNYYQYYRDCKNISQKILQKDNPSLAVSDEDFASLSVAQEMKIPTILITDILETHFTKGLASFIEKKMNKSMQEIIKKCESVIIPEIGDSKDNIKRVGPIVRQTNHTREQLREKLSFDKKTIVISIGGTDAGLFLIEKALGAVSKINQDIKVVLVSGPSVNRNYENVINLGFVDNLHEIIYASDVLISLAGKSTIDEANAYGTPAIFIPIKGHFEQEDNAKDQGFVFEDIKRLDKLIIEKLDERRKQINTEGATKAAKIIQSLIDSH